MDSVQSNNVYDKTHLSKTFKLNFESSLTPSKFRILPKSLRNAEFMSPNMQCYVQFFGYNKCHIYKFDKTSLYA